MSGNKAVPGLTGQKKPAAGPLVLQDGLLLPLNRVVRDSETYLRPLKRARKGHPAGPPRAVRTAAANKAWSLRRPKMYLIRRSRGSENVSLNGGW